MGLSAVINEANISNTLNILYVEDDEEDAKILCDGFKKEKESFYDITHSSTFTDALNQLKNKKFEAILLDLNLPDGKGLSGIDTIKDIYPNMPVVIITGYDDESTAIEALQKGAQEYIVKTHINNEIIKRVLQSSILRKQVEGRLKEKAYTDPLTQLPNRIAFEQTSKKMIERAIRWKDKEALLFIDLNKFKEVNDTYGHEAGNQVLIEVGNRLKNTLRKSDLIARYAGDEFICYLDSSHTQEINRTLCQTIAEKVIHAVEKPIYFEGNTLEISLSIGIGIFPDAGSNFESLLKNADAAMYKAKNNDKIKFCFVEDISNTMESVDEWRKIIEVPQEKIANADTEIFDHDIDDYILALKEEMRVKYDEKFSEFAFMAAHDLRAPVRKIVTFSELLNLQDDDLTPEEHNHFIERLSINGARLNTLIDDLLVYAQVVKNAETLEHICLTELLNEVMDDLKIWLIENNVTIHVDAMPKILGYKIQIRQIFMHLISNAVKFEHTDRKPVIKISHSIQKNQSIIKVQDNGIGIESGYNAQIFKPFKRLHTADQIEGTGLGLTICERAIEKHGGSIWVTSEDNQGSCFEFSFPIHENPD